MKVVVSAVAFSKNKELTSELCKHFSDVVVNTEGKRFTFEELVEYYRNADAIIIGLEQINAPLLDCLPNLKIIVKYGVGLDNIDIPACEARNISIGWTGGVNKGSVAEMALGLMIMLCRNLYITSNQLKNGIWNKSGGRTLAECTVGVIGMGCIGKELVRMLQPLTKNILVNDLIDINDYAALYSATVVEKDRIFREADIISVHTPLTNETRNMIDREQLAIMKRNSFVVNTARGGIINEEALLEVLQQNLIGGAALDVYDIEPPIGNKLLELPNLINTPHIAGNSNEAVIAMGMSAISHLLLFRQNETSKQKCI